jgi:hypothetical protein
VVKRIDIRGDGSWNESPTGAWVSSRAYDALAAELAECKKNCCEAWTPAIDAASDRISRLEAALRGVIRVADRKTDEFDAAHAALATVNR